MLKQVQHDARLRAYQLRPYSTDCIAKFSKWFLVRLAKGRIFLSPDDHIHYKSDKTYKHRAQKSFSLVRGPEKKFFDTNGSAKAKANEARI